MTLSGGLYGPALSRKQTEKEWNGKRSWFKRGQLQGLLNTFTMIHLQETLCEKFYEAEYYDDE